MMETELKQYNIYSGVKGIERLEYKYTVLAESLEIATKAAHDEAVNQYELFEPYSMDDSIDEILSYDEDADPNAEPNKEQLELATSNYIAEQETYLEFKAVLTSEDTISKDDLILDYIDDSDDIDETAGSGD